MDPGSYAAAYFGTNWDFVVVNNLETADKWIADHNIKNIDNLLIRAHGSFEGAGDKKGFLAGYTYKEHNLRDEAMYRSEGIYTSDLLRYNAKSSKNVKALKSISNRLSKHATVALGACGAGTDPQFAIALRQFMSGAERNITLYSNPRNCNAAGAFKSAQEMSLTDPDDKMLSDVEKKYGIYRGWRTTTSKGSYISQNDLFIKPSGGFKRIFQGKKGKKREKVVVKF